MHFWAIFFTQKKQNKNKNKQTNKKKKTDHNSVENDCTGKKFTPVLKTTYKKLFLNTRSIQCFLHCSLASGNAIFGGGRRKKSLQPHWGSRQRTGCHNYVQEVSFINLQIYLLNWTEQHIRGEMRPWRTPSHQNAVWRHWNSKSPTIPTRNSPICCLTRYRSNTTTHKDTCSTS